MLVVVSDKLFSKKPIPLQCGDGQVYVYPYCSMMAKRRLALLITWEHHDGLSIGWLLWKINSRLLLAPTLWYARLSLSEQAVHMRRSTDTVCLFTRDDCKTAYKVMYPTDLSFFWHWIWRQRYTNLTFLFNIIKALGSFVHFLDVRFAHSSKAIFILQSGFLDYIIEKAQTTLYDPMVTSLLIAQPL